MKCEDESQVWTHLESLMLMQEQLIGMAAGLAHADIILKIFSSLPKLYHPLINTITMSATHTKVDLKPDDVIENLMDTFKCLAIGRL